ncbi:ribosomal-protein-alanine N-acetyltransferase [Boudabousia tangfeifanii]|uniref:Ribosomal-protein-alanine N-acetyltransferase n=1 Tax=Boudabousia tangfeifanii TaxID=1912795 RepID=A0A1D9MJ04_9ACTO|nr:ribosomal protein S18-alanine N-acetyltransferase [Boudabousia tangfeifanii]AOZ72262.1 ribosomal-protein-alanine N-acetyltransferase [Boudabousia tangfeifanii]
MPVNPEPRDAALATAVPEGYSLRILTEDEVFDAAAIELEVFPRDAWTVPMLQAEFTGPYRIYLGVFDENSTMVGYAGAMRGGDSIEIMTVGVIETARGKGLGRTLTMALLRAGKAAGVEMAFLEVRESNEIAASLYRSLGFEEIDRRKRYYHQPTEDAVIMACKLD